MGLLASIWHLCSCIYSGVEYIIKLLLFLVFEFTSLLLNQDSPMDLLASILRSAVESILSSAVQNACLLLCGCIYYCFRNTIKFQSNLDALGKEKGRLIELQNRVTQELRVAEIDGKLRTTQVKEWLTKVESIELKVTSLQAGITTNNKKICGSFLNGTLLGRKVAKMLKEVERLLEDGDFSAGMVALNPLPEPVRYIPGASIEDQTTASKTLAETMKRLSEDGVTRIGIWGMGGVGKTTLVKNLNNKLKSISSTQCFGTVIWVTVSKDLDLKRVQTEIANRLGLQASLEESQQGLASRLHERLMAEKKFLLILDDVWEPINLDSLGIPQAESHKGFKIVLTSRSSTVCAQMEVDEKVRVEVLNDEEAWQLFTKKAGSIAICKDIRPHAEAVAKECNGLPLALITVGSALRGKAKVELWKNALNELQRSEPSSISGIEKEVYNPLKWSYDSLHQSFKACFLYCSLFPEDFSIEVSELVQCWLAEGLIAEELNHEVILDRGIAILENLKDLCLLEHGRHEGTVKMHDVIRDVAIWIASSVEDGCKSHVRSGIRLSRISDVELLKSCKRISFMNNRITSLPDCAIQCSKTSTLLLRGNPHLENVPQSFLEGFPALRVLNLSETKIQSLPLSLTKLSELRSLLLQSCDCIKELPPLGGLRKLQVLNLSGTKIRELPEGMEELNNLRQLNLSCTGYLKSIQAGVLSRLFGLEVLNMTGSAYRWGVKGEVEEGQMIFEELGSLMGLTVLHVKLKTMPYLGSRDLIWIKRLRSFKIHVGSDSGVEYVYRCDERVVILDGLDLSEKGVGWLLINLSFNLVLQSCTEISWMFESLATNGKAFAGLKVLSIESCDSLGPFRGCATRDDLLPDLEELHLSRIENLDCVWPPEALPGFRFSRLTLIQVTRCPKFIYLIPHDLIPYLINLVEIKVNFCENLENLFEHSSSGQNMAPDPLLPKLRKLLLSNLPKLRTICREKESWQSLEQIDVWNCYQLRRLPFTTDNANTIKEIRGEERWWSQLLWNDDHDKLSLQHFFKLAELKVEIIVSMTCNKSRSKAMKIACVCSGVMSAALQGRESNQLEVIGYGIDAVEITSLLRKKIGFAELVSVSPVDFKIP